MKIVTIHLNNSKGFELTFKSVQKFIQKNEEVQWLIKDGLSENFQLETIKKNVDGLSRTQIVSFKDTGVYDAMNQTIEMINENDMVLFLNAGDQLTDNFIESYEKDKISGFDLIYSNTLMGKNKKLLVAPVKIDFAYLLGKTINHQSLILKGSLLKKYKFKSDYTIVADWVQLFEILKFEKLNIRNLDYPISIYEGGGISERQDLLRKQERENYLKKMYTDWELESILKMAKLRQRNWYNFVLKSLDSPKRSKLLGLISKIFA